jgi:hypothetical protein
MATRSTIAIEREDGTIAQVYAHWDGYLSHNGKILLENYTTPEQVEALLAGGSISSLGTCIGEKHPFDTYSKLSAEDQALAERAEAEGWTKYYGRDRGEKNVAASVYKNYADYKDNAQFEEYDYIMRKGVWYVSPYGRKLEVLAEALAAEEALED